MKTPSQCFRDNVLPRWQSYQSDPDKPWKAEDAARALNAHVEWLFHYYDRTDLDRLEGARNVRAFRSALYRQCPDIEVVKDLADATGHRFTRGRLRIFHTATDAVVEQHDGLTFDHDGRDVLEVVRGVVNFWRNWRD